MWLAAGGLDRLFNKVHVPRIRRCLGVIIKLTFGWSFWNGPAQVGSLDFLAASRSNGSLAKLCSVTFKGKKFSSIV